jgi:hypothetical protein
VSRCARSLESDADRSHDHPQLTKYPALNQAEQRTNVPKAYLVIGGAALVFILHSVNALAMPVSNLVGLVIPGFLSLRAIETPGNEDNTQYLTYWIIFAFLNFTESLALRVVLYYVPWYFAFKSVFIMWLYLPQFRVSLILPRRSSDTRLTMILRVLKSSTTPPSSPRSLASPTTGVGLHRSPLSRSPGLSEERCRYPRPHRFAKIRCQNVACCRTLNVLCVS